MISATVYSGNTHFQASIYLFFNSCAVLFLSCGEAEPDETLTASENEDEPSSENASENEVDQTKGEEDTVWTLQIRILQIMKVKVK